jgi:hypothetical protein
LVRNSFKLCNVLEASSFHTNFSAFRRSLKAFVAESVDESAESHHAPSQFHQILLALWRLHVSDGVDIGGVGLDASIANNEAKELPRGNTKNPFHGV